VPADAALVAGIDSSTQSCKVVVRDAASGALVRRGRAPHPPGTEVDPEAWWLALGAAVADAGGLDDVAAISIAAQQHGLVALDDRGEVVRPALLWNDTRSAGAATDLVAELGAEAWADQVGSVPVASFTVAKLRWLAEHEPDAAARTAAVCLPHDWLTWRLTGATGFATLATDRGDASGTGYWSPGEDRYRPDLVKLAFGADVLLSPVLDPTSSPGSTAAGAGVPTGVLVGAGTGDNMAAALGVGARPGDVIVSIGTSGVVSATSDRATADATGTVAGFADATGRFLPLVCTLNGAPVLDATARLLGVDLGELSDLARRAPAGADGLVLLPYLDGERTPNLPDATGTLVGLRHATMTPAHVARAAVEGLLCGLADGVDALVGAGVEVRRIVLIGGAAASAAVCEVAPEVFGHPVVVPAPGEYVADGAARQAAWTLAGTASPPEWSAADPATFDADPIPRIRARYGAARSTLHP